MTAVGRLTDLGILAKIAQDDEDEDVRLVASARLEELQEEKTKE